jgi:hypothetical protein
MAEMQKRCCSSSRTCVGAVSGGGSVLPLLAVLAVLAITQVDRICVERAGSHQQSGMVNLQP